MHLFKLKWIVGILFVVLLSGCGGGGSSSTGTGLDVSPTSLNFSAEYTGATPSSQSVSVTITNPDAAFIIYGYAAGTTVPSWMSLSATGGGTSWSVHANITSTSISPGTYHATIRIGIADAGSNLLAYRDVQVTYTVSVTLGVSTPSLSFSYAIGSASNPANQLVGITGTGINWTASVDQTWASLGTSSGIAPGNMAVIVDPTGLAAGTYNATVTISDTGSSATATVGVTLTVSAPAYSLSPSTLAFNGVVGDSGSTQNVSIAVNNGDTVSWTAVAGSAWLSATPSGTTPGTIVVGVDPTVGPLAAGTYNSTISLSGTSGGYPLNTSINVSYTVSDPSFSVNQNSFSFSGVNGSTIASQTLNLSVTNGDNINWSASPGDTWLVLSKASGTTTPDSLSISVDPSIAPLASGTYNSTITLTGTSNGVAMNKVVNVSLSLTKPTLNVTQSSVTLGGSNGMDLATQPLNFSINTGTNAFPWTLALDDGTYSWLIADSTSGSVSSTGFTSNIDANRNGLLGGIYNGTATVSVTVNGDIVTSSAIPVTLNQAPRKLFIADNGVALASMPTVSRLSQTVQVKEVLGTNVSWNASSDQTWLSVTASGTTPGSLTLTADPTGLTTDSLYYATVTVTSPDSAITNTETVRVGFWVGSADPNTNDTLSVTYKEVVADPIRPYVYVHNQGTDIDVYNVHTASLVTTISGVTTTAAGMAVSTDGSTLWVVDSTNTEVLPVDLDTYTVGTAWPVNAATWFTRIVYARPGGYGVLYVGDGRSYEAASGSLLTPTFPSTRVLATSLDGNRLCALNSGISPYTVTCYASQYTTFAGAGLSLTSLGSGPFGVGSNGSDVAISADGSRVYVASGSPYAFSIYDGSTMAQIAPSLTGRAYPVAIEVASNGFIYGGVSPVSSTNPEIYSYNAAETAQATYEVAGGSIINRQLAVSGDANRVIVLTGQPAMQFLTSGP